MSNHAECECECCGYERRMILAESYLPSSVQSAESWLNGNPDLRSQGPISPQQITAGSLLYVSRDYVSQGQVSFEDFDFQTLDVVAFCDPMNDVGNTTFFGLPQTTRYGDVPPTLTGSFSLVVGDVAAAVEYELAVVPASGSARELISIPVPGAMPPDFVAVEQQTPPGEAREGYGCVLVRSLGDQSQLDVLSLPGSRPPFDAAPTTPAASIDVMLFESDGVVVVTHTVFLLNIFGGNWPPLDQFATGRLPQASPAVTGENLECRVVIERNGVLVSDRVRPSQSQYVQDLEPDGEYVVAKYFSGEFDAPWEGGGQDERKRQARPYVEFLTKSEDTTIPIIGCLPLDDVYANEQPSGPFVVVSTKPLDSSALFRVLPDDSMPGNGTRPAYETRSMWVLASGASQGLFLPAGSYLIRPRGTIASNSNNYRDQNDERPAGLPQFPYVVHAVPAKKPPRPRFIHPGLSTREQFRPRLPSEQVKTVDLVLSSAVVSSDVLASQFELRVDGQLAAVEGVTEVGDGGTLFRVSIPVAGQQPGAFVTLYFNPGGAVRSRDVAEPAVALSCRTSWLMQKPHFRTPSIATSSVLVGSVGSMTTQIDHLPRTASLVLSEGVSWRREDAIFSLRPQQDGFVPEMPTEDDERDNCSYYGLTTTIHPCPPRRLICPGPMAAQRHNSAFRYGGAESSMSLRVVFLNRSTGAEVPLTDDDETVTLGSVSPISRLKLLSLHGAFNLQTQFMGHDLPQNFYTAKVDASEGFVTEVDAVDWVRRDRRFLAMVQAWVWATRRVTQIDALESAFTGELGLNVFIRIVVREQTLYEQKPGGITLPENTTETWASHRILDSFGVTKAKEEEGTFYVACGITTGLPGDKMPFWKITL
jgi:hypothetical protein